MMRVTEYPDPPEAPEPEALEGFQFLSELKGAREAWRLPLALRRLSRLPKGDGSQVILIPGWMAPEESMAALRWFLRRQDYDARYWGLGVNRGNPESDSEILVEQVAALVAETGQKVTLVGWSLGGVIARETARQLPEGVLQVITYGTPVIGGPTFTPAAKTYGESECQRISELIVEMDEQMPITTPISSIFTRNDRVVSWPACIDRSSPNVTHYEVRSTHISMGFDPDVWRIILECLGRFDRQ